MLGPDNAGAALLRAERGAHDMACGSHDYHRPLRIKNPREHAVPGDVRVALLSG